MAGTLSPNAKFTGFDNAGIIVPGGKLFTYASGTTTKQNTYTDVGLTTPNANPIILDSAGRATIFLDTTLSYKYVLAPSTDTDPPSSPIWTQDTIGPIPATNVALDTPGTAGENLTAGQVVYLSDGSGSLTAGRWYRASATNAYSSTTAPAIGMMMANLNSGVLGTIRLQGQVTALSALVAGTIYYVATSAGTLTATAPGNAVAVGVADSTTSLILSQRSGISVSQNVGTTNLLADPTFLIWPAGDTTAPAHWTLTGGGATIARTGTGLSDTNRKVGDFCAKVVGSLAIADLQQDLLPTAAFSRFNFLQGQSVSAGVWVRSGLGTGQIGISDGIGTSLSSGNSTANAWSWITVTRTIDLSATKLSFLMRTNASTTNYYSGPVFILGPIAPAYYQPAPQHYIERTFHTIGAVAAGADKFRFSFARPGIVKDVQLHVVTAPTGAALIVNVRSWDGAALASMFSTRPQIAIGNTIGGAQPDATYARRCFSGGFGTATNAGAFLSVDYDQVGSGVAGADLEVMIRVLSYNRPLEEALSYNDIT